MRYFSTRNASRPYKAGGLSFEFEPTELLGGSLWLGVLAVDEPAASILANAGFAQVKELSLSEYEEAKKKIQAAEQLRSAAVTPAPTPKSSCNSCGASNPAQVRNR